MILTPLIPHNSYLPNGPHPPPTLSIYNQHDPTHPYQEVCLTILEPLLLPRTIYIFNISERNLLIRIHITRINPSTLRTPNLASIKYLGSLGVVAPCRCWAEISHTVYTVLFLSALPEREVKRADDHRAGCT